MTKQIQLTEEQLKNLKAFLDRVTLSGFEIASYNDLIIALFHTENQSHQGIDWAFNPQREVDPAMKYGFGTISSDGSSLAAMIQDKDEFIKGRYNGVAFTGEKGSKKLGKDVDTNA